MLRLLCVVAHPDDESGCFGGILSKYSEAGVDCAVISLTAGERATNRGGLVEDNLLKARRRMEFSDACRYLGASRSEVWNYRDGLLDREDFHQVVGQLVRYLRQFRPQVVATFGTDGFVTAHPDHGMAGLFTAAAFQWAGRANRWPEQLKDGLAPWQPDKLYQVTAEFSLKERPPISLSPVTARVNIDKYVDRKNEAFALHKTQLPLLPIFKHAQEQAGTCELFHLSATRKVTEPKLETDLFEGVEE
ncbi:MAG: PIG-L family deacetylase [Acidobacteriota bacterium]|nr:PIG-L family deacetylase [Acidobacteriota bacterium]